MTKEFVAADNVRFIQQAIDLIRASDDETYTKTFEEFSGCAIGGHLRHLHDQYVQFLNGFKHGRVDYEERECDPQMVEDREYAVTKWEKTIKCLHDIDWPASHDQIDVRMDEGGANPEEDWCRSTVKRELLCLAMQSVAHFAIIASMLRLAGKEVPEGFGVEPCVLRAGAE